MTGRDFEDLVNLFIRFPGIGPRQARRFVFFLLSQNHTFRNELITTLSTLDRLARQCRQCHYFFTADMNQSFLCRRCLDQATDHSLLMIVEKDMDADTVIKTDTYPGLFFILGQLKTVGINDPKKIIRLPALKKLVTDLSQKKELTEIILALNASPDSDIIANLIHQELDPLSKKYQFKISSLGRGLSTGAELEYADAETLKNALSNRH